MNYLYIPALLVFLVVGCARENSWHHTPFSNPPLKSLEQARAICVGQANNSSYVVSNISGNINCETNSTFGVLNTTCGNTPSKRAGLAAYNNTYSSCMASNGWNAKVISHEKAVEMLPQAAYDACLETHGNKYTLCTYGKEKKKEKLCDCRIKGGHPDKF